MVRNYIKAIINYVLPHKGILYLKQIEVVIRCYWGKMYYEPEEKIILEILKNHNSGCVIDVGLNLGQYSLPFSKLNNVKSIIALEPQKTVSQIIKSTLRILRIKKVKVYETFAGKEQGFAKINLKNDDNSPRGQESFMDFTDINELNKVEVYKLDNLVEMHKDCSNVVFIKADVEGAEMQVLLGAEKIIDTYKPLLMLELQDKFLARFENSIKEVMSWMQSKNYTAFYLQGFGLVEWDKQSEPETVNYFFIPDNIKRPLHNSPSKYGQMLKLPAS